MKINLDQILLLVFGITACILFLTIGDIPENLKLFIMTLLGYLCGASLPSQKDKQ